MLVKKDVKILLDNDKKRTAELNYLRRLVKNERSHCQKRKQSLNLVLLVFLILLNLFLGSKNSASIIGIKKCSGWYWAV